LSAAEHHVLHQHRIEIVARADGVERRYGEIDRRNLVQRTVGLAASARGANGIVDIGFSHGGLPVMLSSRTPQRSRIVIRIECFTRPAIPALRPG
jgi:hypothetical protein